MVKTKKNKERKINKTIKHRRTKNIVKEFINKMFTLQLTLKMIHWTTQSYATHKATDKSLDTLLPLIDNFVEAYLGKYKNELHQYDIQNITICKVLNNHQLQKYISKVIVFLESLNLKDGDLISIKDDIVSELNILKYLLDLKK